MQGSYRHWIGESRWRIAAWLLPPILIVLFAHKALLPLAVELNQVRSQLAIHRENTYEKAWLDSTSEAMKREVELLRAFHLSRRAALARDTSIPATVDRIRALAQSSGIEVVKTLPQLSRSDSLNTLRIRLEGLSPYTAVMAFFRSLEKENPDLYLEEMLIRRSGSGGEKLESHFVVVSHAGKGGFN